MKQVILEKLPEDNSALLNSVLATRCLLDRRNDLGNVIGHRTRLGVWHVFAGPVFDESTASNVLQVAPIGESIKAKASRNGFRRGAAFTTFSP